MHHLSAPLMQRAHLTRVGALLAAWLYVLPAKLRITEYGVEGVSSLNRADHATHRPLSLNVQPLDVFHILDAVRKPLETRKGNSGNLGNGLLL